MKRILITIIMMLGIVLASTLSAMAGEADFDKEFTRLQTNLSQARATLAKTKPNTTEYLSAQVAVSTASVGFTRFMYLNALRSNQILSEENIELKKKITSIADDADMQHEMSALFLSLLIDHERLLPPEQQRPAVIGVLTEVHGDIFDYGPDS